jgi:uncharacterized protein
MRIFMEEPVQPRLKPYPTLKQTWGLLGWLLLITIVFTLWLLLIKLALGSRLPDSVFTNPWFMLFQYTVLFVSIILLGFRLKRRTEPDYSIVWKLLSPAEGFLILMITLGLYFLIDPITDLIPMPELIKQLFAELLGDRSLPTVLMLVVAAPICEELLFRGIILDGLLKNYAPRRAIIWSALFFGIGHLNPWQFVAGFVLGLFMGWVYYRTRSLTATVFIHFVANGSGVLLGWLLVADPQQWVTTRSLVGNDLLYFGLLAVALMMIIIAAQKLNRLWRDNTSAAPAFPEVKAGLCPAEK